MGGSWERIQDVFLLCAGSTYAAGTTGGEANVTLTVEQMPSHSHPLVNAKSNFDPSYGFGYLASVDRGENRAIYNPTGDTGGGQAHNNMPPYLAVYCWRRVA